MNDTNKKKSQYFKFCNCGKIMNYNRKDSLKNSIKLGRRCKSCSQLGQPKSDSHKANIKQNNGMRGKVAANRKPEYMWLYNKLISQANKRGIECDLTYDQFVTLTKTENCAYCNAKVEWQPFHDRHTTNYSTHIDRKDNSLGYTESNVCVSCWSCNVIKGNRFTYEQMKKLGEVISTFYEKNKEI